MQKNEIPYESRLYCYQPEKQHILFGPHRMTILEVERALAELRQKWNI